MTDWTRIEQLNGGERAYHVGPPLDTSHEVWFYSGDSLLRVWSEGVLFKHEETAPPITAPVTARFCLYKVLDQLFVDVEVRGEEALVRRGVLNGHSVVASVAASRVEPLLAHYRALGFREGTPWNATKTRVTVREYRGGASGKWTVHVDGTTVIENMRELFPTPSRDAAIALAQERIHAQEREGARVYLIELMAARHPNPEPKPARGTKRKAPEKKAALAKPATAHEAVDAAVALLRDLHARLPTAHFVAECLDLETERARVESVEPHAAFFLSTHAQRVGRWSSAGPRAPKENESSWDYFARVYGSITWVLDGEADAGLEMFYCGNVTGGGWSCLEILEEGDSSIIEELAEATGNEDMNQLLVFHGGEHDGRGWAFDRRVKSPGGEFAIIPFDDAMDTLPRRVKPERIVPFGDWLYKRVVSLTRVAERNLREVN